MSGNDISPQQRKRSDGDGRRERRRTVRDSKTGQEYTVMRTIPLNDDGSIKNQSEAAAVFTPTDDRLQTKRDNFICLSCGETVADTERYGPVFESMHYVCFHYAYEHDGDRDQPCHAGGCPASPPASAHTCCGADFPGEHHTDCPCHPDQTTKETQT